MPVHHALGRRVPSQDAKQGRAWYTRLDYDADFDFGTGRVVIGALMDFCMLARA